MRVRAAAGTEIEKLEIIKDGSVVHTREGDALTIEDTWVDPAAPSACWYYVRLTLREQAVCEENMVGRKQFAWSSPIWLDR